jgi:hypothetical protein
MPPFAQTLVHVPAPVHVNGAQFIEVAAAQVPALLHRWPAKAVVPVQWAAAPHVAPTAAEQVPP